MWRGVRKCRLLKIMCLSIYDYQSKASRYRNRSIYSRNKATRNPKTYNRFKKSKNNTTIKQKEIIRHKEKKEGPKKTQNQLENKVEMAINICVNNYLKYQWTGCSNQKTE